MSTLAQIHDAFDHSPDNAVAALVRAHLAARATQRRIFLVISLFVIAIIGGVIAGRWDSLFPGPDLVTFAFRV